MTKHSLNSRFNDITNFLSGLYPEMWSQWYWNIAKDTATLQINCLFSREFLHIEVDTQTFEASPDETIKKILDQAHEFYQVRNSRLARLLRGEE